MIHSEVFQRCVADSPVCVMVQTLMENALSPTTVDALFERHAVLQYTQDLLFSDLVNLMSLVVGGIRPSINSAFKTMAPVLGVTRKAIYDKIDRVETTTSAALARHSGSALGAISDERDGRKEPWLGAIASRSSTAATGPGPSLGSSPFVAPASGPCPVTPWSCSTPSGCGSSTSSRARTATRKSVR